ncbi:hypothetical protein ACUOA8_32095, partial [Escherichia sp. SS-MK2]
ALAPCTIKTIMICRGVKPCVCRIAIEPLQVIVIALVAMAIALLSTLYPSWRAAATQPAEALRYE